MSTPQPPRPPQPVAPALVGLGALAVFVLWLTGHQVAGVGVLLVAGVLCWVAAEEGRR